jgi:hypothetical protein
MKRTTLLMLVLVGGLLAPGGAARGQVSGVTLEVDPQAVGFGGAIAPAQWNPLRATIDYRSDEPRQVVCRWLASDADEDRVIARREVVLNPQRADQTVWLYAPLPNPANRSLAWTVQVLDGESENLLASTQVGLRNVFDPAQQRLGVMATADLGLSRYTDKATRHEAIALIRGMSLAELPDRWFGLSALQTLIWTPQSAKPTDANVAPAQLAALREWVARGGHLVISLPAVNQTWTDSTLADMLPIDDRQLRVRRGAAPPSALGPVRGEVAQVDLTVFDIADDADASAIARDRQGSAFVVAGRHGLGRVTVIGLDLTSPPVRQMGLPFGKYRIWNQIFRWQGPVLAEGAIEAQRRAQAMDRPRTRQAVEPDRFVPAMIAMRETAAPMLLGAVVLFGLYWLLAGPVSYFVLRQRGLAHYSWLGFLLVVVVFGLVSWGGAVATQPNSSRVSHFSIVTARADSDQVHTQSWLSLFVPEFGLTEVALGPDQPEAPNTLAAPGLPRGTPSAGFTDRRQYTLDAAAPNQAAMPFRSTAKQLTLDYQGTLDRAQDATAGRWVMPQGELSIENHWPTGKLGHGLPRDLQNVLVVYCPGDGEMPWVWRHGTWPADKVIDLSQRGNVARLVKRPAKLDKDRAFQKEGFLGQLIDQKTGRQFIDMPQGQWQAANSELVKAIEMLSFYDALPAPNFRKIEFGASSPVNVERTLGRALDMTHLTQGKRVIIIGHMLNAPLPAPLAVDDQPVPAEGWTVVRWIYDFDGE